MNKVEIIRRIRELLPVIYESFNNSLYIDLDFFLNPTIVYHDENDESEIIVVCKNCVCLGITIYKNNNISITLTNTFTAESIVNMEDNTSENRITIYNRQT